MLSSLVADYSDNTSSSSDADNSEDDVSESTKSTLSSHRSIPLLPSANLLLSSTSKTTVFSNPYLLQEKAEIDKLQKHVKMVESEEHLIQKNGRKICWNNRKGRCRFGNKCKYAHDSDLVAFDEGEDDIVKEEKSPTISPPMNATITKSAHLSHNLPPGVDQVTDTGNPKSKTRKRPGLGDSIKPGKKVMKQYQTTKAKPS